MPAYVKGAHISPKKRLAAPSTLAPPAKKLFDAIVKGVDPSHFAASDEPLIAQYAGAADLARQAQRHLDEEGAVVDGKASPWLTVLEKSTRACVALSARLRLCPQSRFDRLTAGANSRGQSFNRKPWETEDDLDDPDGLLAR